jgi:hypothetical protein
VEEPVSGIGCPAIGSYRHCGGLPDIFLERRVWRIDEDRRTDGTEIAGRAKGHGAVHTLRSPISPGTLGPIEREFLTIHGKKVLTKKLAEVLKNVTKSANNRKITPDRVRRLRDIDDRLPATPATNANTNA